MSGIGLCQVCVNRVLNDRTLSHVTVVHLRDSRWLLTSASDFSLMAVIQGPPCSSIIISHQRATDFAVTHTTVRGPASADDCMLI